jgi:hypothetical protein
MSTERAPEYLAEDPEESGLKRRSAATAISPAPDERQEVTSIFTAYGFEDAPSTQHLAPQGSDTDSTLIRLGISAMVTIISAAVWVAIMPEGPASTASSAPPYSAPPSAAPPSAAVASPMELAARPAEVAPDREPLLPVLASPARTPSVGAGVLAPAHSRPTATGTKRARTAVTVPTGPSPAISPTGPRKLSSDPYGEPKSAVSGPRAGQRVSGVVQDNPY